MQDAGREDSGLPVVHCVKDGADMTPTDRVIRMDTKRRLTLPSDLLEAAGIAVEEDLVASTDGDGVVVLRSRSASMRQIRAEVSSGFGPDGPRRHSTSLREDREADDASLDRRMGSESANSDAPGAALVSRLGLD
jgi:bifunctional DNA-binding transcriptional regulator/antitoxin component of YhaV-PrlF toxin-antitoxin module